MLTARRLSRRAKEAAITVALAATVPLALGIVLIDDFSIPASVVALGVIIGLTYGLLAVGLVLVYRTSGVVNFAHAEVGTLAGSLFGVWVAATSIGGFGLPYWLMLPAAMATGALASMTVEVVAVRRLRRVPKVMSLVMTLGAAQFMLFVSLAVNTQIRLGSLYPRPPGMPTFDVGALTITPEYSAMLVISPIVVAALALFLSRSRFGIALRAAADNRENALLSAIPADRMSSLAWALAGATSAFVAILLFPQRGFVAGELVIGPALLLRALLPAVVARFYSLPVAFVFGVILGVIEQVSLWNTTTGGPTEIVILVLLLAILATRGRESTRVRSRENWALAKPWPPIPKEWRQLPRVKAATVVSGALAAVVFLALGLSSNKAALAFSLVVAYTLVGLSIYVITGLSGELSLGQFAVAGVGAVVSVQFVDSVLRSVPAGVLVGGLAGAAISIVIGIPALRIRGMMLGVATLSFAVAAEAWLFAQPWAIGSGLQPARLVVGGDVVTASRHYFLFSIPFLLGALWLVRNISRSGYGRAIRALRDNEDAARAFGIPATGRKLQAFAFAGFLAGAGGALYAHGLPRLDLQTFGAAHSITVVAITLIGGLSLMVGPLLGALYLLALPALVQLDAVGLAVSTFGWLLLLLYFPGGLAAAARPLRDRALLALAGERSTSSDAVAARESTVEQMQTAARAEPSMLLARQTPHTRTVEPATLLEVDNLSKSFGGLRAVADVSLQVHEGETLGIIGPNGAGKTTLFELVAGFTRPDAGHIRFDGTELGNRSPERRARLGLVRSFQDARLFPTLTVRETLALASERLTPSHFWPALSAWPSAVAHDRSSLLTADDLVEVMGLGRFANKEIGELSTGTRRITDLAALIALQPRLVLLDEPSSGVAQRETEALGELLAHLKELLETTFVIIEHDMPLMLAVSERMVAMEAGKVIAVGLPAEVVNDPLVVEGYLGYDHRAVERSGARTSASDNGQSPQQLPVARAGAPEVTTP